MSRIERGSMLIFGISLAVLGVNMLWSVAAVAHPGGLDANGCHNNNSTGVYECHSGEHEGTTWDSREAYEASLVPVDPPVIDVPDGVAFVGVPDWSTLKQYPVLFRSETVWMVSDGQYLYQVEPAPPGSDYPLIPVSRSKIATINGDEFGQLIQAIQDAPL